MLSRHRTLLLPAVLGLFVFAVYVFSAPNDMWGNGDTYLRYQTTQAIVDHHVFHYVSTIAEPAPRWHDGRSAHGVDNKLYTIYDPGQIFAMAPLYVMGKFLAHHGLGTYQWTPIYTTHLLDDIFGSLLAIVFFLIALRLGYSRRIAALLTLIFAFASVAWPDAESMLEHTQVTFFLALSVLAAMIFVQGGLRQRWWIVGSAISIGCAFLTRYDVGLLLPIIPLYLAGARISLRRPLIHAVDPAVEETPVRSVWRMIEGSISDIRLWRSVAVDWVIYLAALVPAFAAAAAWDYVRFASLTNTHIPPTFGEPIWQGFSGLILSPGKGLIWYMPILFALPFVIRHFYRQHRLTTFLFGAIVMIQVLEFSNVIYWHGDPAWGPRYIYSTVPFLVLPLGIILERWAALTKIARAGFVGLIVLSFSVQLVGVITPQYRFWYKEIHSQLVARQGFNWGSKYGHFWYYYYWDVNRNPILISFDNLYEITALRIFGQDQYRLTASPVPRNQTSVQLDNPLALYEINNYNLWWLGTYEPLIGTHKDAILAGFWFLLAAGSLVYLRKEMKEAADRQDGVVVELKRKPA